MIITRHKILINEQVEILNIKNDGTRATGGVRLHRTLRDTTLTPTTLTQIRSQNTYTIYIIFPP